MSALLMSRAVLAMECVPVECLPADGVPVACVAVECLPIGCVPVGVARSLSWQPTKASANPFPRLYAARNSSEQRVGENLCAAMARLRPDRALECLGRADLKL